MEYYTTQKDPEHITVLSDQLGQLNNEEFPASNTALSFLVGVITLDMEKGWAGGCNNPA
jgi:hypothetical protein